MKQVMRHVLDLQQEDFLFQNLKTRLKLIEIFQDLAVCRVIFR